MSSSRVAVISVRLQVVECVSRYSANGHLQKLAAVSTLSTSSKFKAMQNCHIIAKQQPKSASTCILKSSFISHPSEVFLFNPVIHLSCSILIYINRYIILITIFYMLKFNFRALKFYLSSHSRLKIQSLSILLKSCSRLRSTGSRRTRLSDRPH